MSRFRGFTLIELLVVISVIAVLAAILFPVFASAKAAAIQTSCLSRFHQVSHSVQMYLGDYDDVFMPVNHEPGQPPDPTSDRTWVQMILPYIGNFQSFQCPADSDNAAENDVNFDEDLLPGDLSARFYTASMHVNVGYNFQYLAPVLKEQSQWTSLPKSESTLEDPSGMLMFIDSAWQIQNGQPVGGGNYIVSPPCRYENIAGAYFDTITSTPVASIANAESLQVFAPVDGWQPMGGAGQNFGGAWPWHTDRATVTRVDGSAKALTMNQLEAGCDLRPAWAGVIVDRHAYTWSPQ